ncbi:hypothetical protein [Reichenbachiella sp. MALMAid0571]|uniref:hypothetical protein n=1 Tax=Reichenbachiella sp. MALMAid0571 TaxID=3143939 RepID=UPI0032DF0B39
MKDQVVELVVYEVKKELSDGFIHDIIPNFRKLILSFGGIVSYHTYSSLNKDGVYYDHVVWENPESASVAIQKFEKVREEGKHKELLNSFEKVVFMDHFKLVS